MTVRRPSRFLLDSAAQVYARLSAHYLARPLRTDFPPCAPSVRGFAWDNFPAWGVGPPEQLCIATDGSGHEHGGWAFAVWVCGVASGTAAVGTAGLVI